MPAAVPIIALALLAVSGEEDAAKAKARELVERAGKAYRAHRMVEAGELYLEAHGIVEANRFAPKPELLYNAALAFDDGGACDRAAELYDRFLAERPEALKKSKELARRVDRARACAPSVRVETTPPGAAIAVDGRSRGVTPVELRLKAGEHALVLALAEHRSVDESFSVARGKPLTIARVLERVKVEVAAKPVEPLPALRVRAEDPPHPKDDAPPLVTAAVHAPEARERSPWIWVSGGAGVVGIAGGILFRALSIASVHRYQQSLDAQLMLPSDMRSSRGVRDEVDTAVREETISNLSFAVGGAALATAVVLYLVEEGE